MKTKLLIIIGIVMMIEGFSIVVYSSSLLPLTEPPIMRPIEGIDYVFFKYSQVFLFSGIAGIFVTISGIILSRRKRK